MSAAETRPRRTAPRVPRGLVGAALLVLAVALLLKAISGLWPSFGNPFRTETVDRSSPVVLKSLQDLHRFEAASGHFEVIVDVEKDTRFVPSAVRGERVLFVAVGSVDAGVDFDGVDADAIDVSADRRRVTLTLPPARFVDARVDPARSYVYDRDRGLIDRVASLFQDSPTGERELYVLAEAKLLAAARNGSGILARAERNTRLMLVGMLRALGFHEVTVRYVAPSAE
jgi:hypothetical protein